MSSDEALNRKIETAKELQAIVKTMKALAAVSIRQYEKAVESLLEYSNTLEMGMQALLKTYPAQLMAVPANGNRRVGGVIFGSDQGMCGRFNEQLATYALATLGVAADAISSSAASTTSTSSSTSTTSSTASSTASSAVSSIPAASSAASSAPAPVTPWLLVVGSRMAAQLEERGYAPQALFPVPSSLSGITPTVQQLVLYLEQRCFASAEALLAPSPALEMGHNGASALACDRILVFHNGCLGESAYRPQHRQLFPLDAAWLQHLRQRPWPSRCLPMTPLSPERLLSALFRQSFFVGLYRACAESLASENASRLASMQLAETHIADRLLELQAEFQRQRQTGITEELLDIVAGFEALNPANGHALP